MMAVFQRRSGRLSLACLVVIGTVVWAQQAPPAQSPTPSRTAQAQAVLDSLLAKDFAKIVVRFDATMKAALTEQALREGWDKTSAQLGALVTRGAPVEQPRGAYITVVIPCEFANGKLDFTVVFNAAGEIAGLSMRPPAAPWAPPDYAIAANYTEREVTVGAGEWALPGTLTMPVGTGPFPALVLVHGSGPNDRDETLGPNKTFKDLALGLASRGIAVLRYDKRTKVYGSKVATLKQFTVKEETIDDALAAVALLRSNASIDPGRVFVLGHSLGGMLIPRIGAADSKIAGLVVMAGAVQPLDRTILQQFQYLAEADGTVTPAEQQQIDNAKKTIAEVAALTAEDAKSGRMISGAPAAYWLDLRGYDPPAVAAKLPQRMLVLQGARDYQVTVAEFERWKTGLAKKTNVEFHLYPSLNHLFLPGTGKSLPAEYATPGHVPVDVVNDIAAWLKGQ